MSQARTLGAFIRQRREDLGLTQEEAGNRAGFPNRQRWSQLEGYTKLSSPEVRRLVAEVLGVRHVDLLIAAGEIDPEEVPATDGVTPPSEIDRLYRALTPVSKQSALGYLRQLAELDEWRSRGSRDATPAPSSDPRPEVRNTSAGSR